MTMELLLLRGRRQMDRLLCRRQPYITEYAQEPAPNSSPRPQTGLAQQTMLYIKKSYQDSNEEVSHATLPQDFGQKKQSQYLAPLSSWELRDMSMQCSDKQENCFTPPQSAGFSCSVKVQA